MPVSFWFFLAVCVISFVPVIKDHGDSWREYKSSSEKDRKRAALQVFALWAVPIFTAIATVITGFEAISSGKEISTLQNQAANAMKRVEELKKENLKLYDRIQPRRITNEQEKILIENLKDRFQANPRINIVTDANDIEQRIFARQICDVLTVCGFKIGFFEVASLPNSPGDIVAPLEFGVEFGFSGPRSSHMDEVLKAFKLAAVVPDETLLRHGPTIFQDANTLVIRILHKPID